MIKKKKNVKKKCRDVFLKGNKYTTTSICNKKCYNKFKLINYSLKILN